MHARMHISGRRLTIAIWLTFLPFKVKSQKHVPISSRQIFRRARRVPSNGRPQRMSLRLILLSRQKSFWTAFVGPAWRADLLQAADLLKQALARDPQFFQAYWPTRLHGDQHLQR